MTSPAEELNHSFIYIVTYNGKGHSGYLESPRKYIAEYSSLAGARMAIENVIEKPKYHNCTFTIHRRPSTEWEIVEYHGLLVQD